MTTASTSKSKSKPKKSAKKRTPASPRTISRAKLHAALIKCEGHYSEAARMLGCSRGSVWARVQADPSLMDFHKDLNAAILDDARATVARLAKTEGSMARFVVERLDDDFASRTKVDVALGDDIVSGIASALGGDVDRLRKLRDALKA